MDFKIDKTYAEWLIALKSKIAAAQLKAAVSVHTELILLYWDIGKMIAEKQQNNKTAIGAMG